MYGGSRDGISPASANVPTFSVISPVAIVCVGETAVGATSFVAGTVGGIITWVGGTCVGTIGVVVVHADKRIIVTTNKITTLKLILLCIVSSALNW